MRALPLELSALVAVASAGAPRPSLRRRFLANARRLDDSGGADDGASFDFDPTSHSLAYHRCASVRQFDDDLVTSGTASSVFATKHLAVVRLCPSDTCSQESYYRSGDTVFDRLRYSGANGYGCQSNYGEYILELGDYLDIMADYHSDRFEQYCSACKSCLYNAYQNWIDGWDSGRRELKEMSDLSWMEDLETAEFQMHRELDFNPYESCSHYDTCKSYKNTCANGVDDSLVGYFQCTAKVGYDGATYYIGPHCGSDYMTIALGVFSDEGCNEYIGDSVGIEDVLGYEIDDAALFDTYLTGSTALEAQLLTGNYTATDDLCTPCLASNQLYESYGNANTDDDDDDVDDGQYQYGDAGEVSQICSTLYASSAKCDQNIQRYNNNNYNYYRSTEEKVTCNYIDAIVHGSYDSMGFVRTNYSLDNYSPDILQGTALQQVTIPQISGLALALVACVSLGTWACLLGGCRLRRRKRKSRRKPRDDDTTLYTAPSMESEAIETAMTSGAVSIASTKDAGEVTEVKALQREIEDLRKQLKKKGKAKRRASTPIKTVYSEEASDLSSYYSSHGSDSSYTRTTRDGRTTKGGRTTRGNRTTKDVEGGGEGQQNWIESLIFPVSGGAASTTGSVSETHPGAASPSGEILEVPSRAASPAHDMVRAASTGIFSRLSGFNGCLLAENDAPEKLSVVDELKDSESQLPADADALRKDIEKMDEQLEAIIKAGPGNKPSVSASATVTGSRMALDVKRSESSKVRKAPLVSFAMKRSRTKLPQAKVRSPNARETLSAPVVEEEPLPTSDASQRATFLPRATSLSANIAALHEEIDDMKKRLREESSMSSDEAHSKALSSSEKSKKKMTGRIKRIFGRKAK